MVTNHVTILICLFQKIIIIYAVVALWARDLYLKQVDKRNSVYKTADLIKE
jgi:hypothetical protein